MEIRLLDRFITWVWWWSLSQLHMGGGSAPLDESPAHHRAFEQGIFFFDSNIMTDTHFTSFGARRPLLVDWRIELIKTAYIFFIKTGFKNPCKACKCSMRTKYNYSTIVTPNYKRKVLKKQNRKKTQKCHSTELCDRSNI